MNKISLRQNFYRALACASVQSDIFFYRATICVSAVLAVGRCPSVCRLCRPSQSCIVAKRQKISSDFFLGQVALLSSFLESKRRYQNFKGDTLSGVVKFTGVGKICDFRLKSLFISDTVQDRPIVAIERYEKS